MISAIGQHRSERPHISDRSIRAIEHVGQAVNLAVERFVTVGETIADDNPDIKHDMYDSCKEARVSGTSIERLYIMENMQSSVNRGAMIRAAKLLLSSITRVLLLADIVVVKQLLLAKDKVARSLGKLESVANFTEFVKAFSIFGTEMIELAHVTDDRQNDVKDERRRAQMSAARQVLERSTMMLLTSSKTCLTHPECLHSRENRDTVFCQMRRAMDLIHYVVKDGILERSNERAPTRQTSVEYNGERAAAFTCLRHFSRSLEMSRPRFEKPYNQKSKESTLQCPDQNDNNASREYYKENQIERRERELMRSNSERDKHIGVHQQKKRNCSSMDREFPSCVTRGEISNLSISILSAQTREHLLTALDKLIEKTQDFTDSAYTRHEHRENILLLCDRAKLELNQLLRIAVNMEQFSTSSFDIDTSIDSVLSAIEDISQQLTITVVDQTAELNHIVKSGIELINSIRNFALNHELDRFQENADRFHDCIDHMLEVCKLLRHVALTETLQVQAKFTEINLRIYGPQVITAARTLSIFPRSKIAIENLDVFVDMWEWLSNDLIRICKDVIDLVKKQTRPQQEYLSLPRPGKHGTTSKPLKPSRLDQDEQEKIAKAGAEMKMLTNEMDAETDKWNGASDENNDIVKRARNMSAMAFSMYQFTKGEGNLGTTQDLFTQAEYFAEEANRLYKVVRQFSYQVPAGDPKKDLLEHLDKVPTFVQSLQFTVKDPTVGKAATFVKVDHVIQEIKKLMNIINKNVTTCFDCANKYKLDFSGLAGRMASASARDDEGNSGIQGDSKGSTTNTENSM